MWHQTHVHEKPSPRLRLIAFGRTWFGVARLSSGFAYCSTTQYTYIIIIIGDGPLFCMHNIIVHGVRLIIISSHLTWRDRGRSWDDRADGVLRLFGQIKHTLGRPDCVSSSFAVASARKRVYWRLSLLLLLIWSKYVHVIDVGPRDNAQTSIATQKDSEPTKPGSNKCVRRDEVSSVLCMLVSEWDVYWTRGFKHLATRFVRALIGRCQWVKCRGQLEGLMGSEGINGNHRMMRPGWTW